MVSIGHESLKWGIFGYIFAQNLATQPGFDLWKKTFFFFSDWSGCSKTCIKSVNELAVQSRSRTCEPASLCTIGKFEQRDCNVPFCPPGCPTILKKSMNPQGLDRLLINATFEVEKVRVLYGKLDTISLTLVDIDDNAGSPDHLEWRDSEALEELQGTIYNLHMGATYRPVIRITSSIKLEKESNDPTATKTYETKSNFIHECNQQEFTCEYWKCDDGKNEIEAWKLCDGNSDCPDKSDEDSSRCTGSPNIGYAVSGFLFGYIILGGLAYICK